MFDAEKEGLCMRFVTILFRGAIYYYGRRGQMRRLVITTRTQTRNSIHAKFHKTNANRIILTSYLTRMCGFSFSLQEPDILIASDLVYAL